MESRILKIQRQIMARQMFELEIQDASKRILSQRTASSEYAEIRNKWAKEENLRAIVEGALGGFLERAKKKLKGLVPDGVMTAWSKARGVLQKFTGIFKNPRAVRALTKMIGDLTPPKIKAFLKEGQKQLTKVFGNIRMALMQKSDLPTLTDLIKRTAVGAGIAKWFNEKVKPKADVVEDFLQKYIPNLKRVAYAAIFAFIWLNVDELSWEMPDLINGFTGNMTLAELLATLPESAIGALSGSLFGIGYTIMPYMILGRILWMIARKYISWDGSKFTVNFNLVNREAFDSAPGTPEYRQMSFA